MNKNLSRIFILMPVLSLASDGLEPALQRPLAPALNSWVANFHEQTTARALKTYTRNLNELSIFGVGAHRDGSLAPETDFIKAAIASTKRIHPRPRVLITVANIRSRKLQDQWLIRHWLGAEDKWTQHAKDLIQLARPVDGLDIDYENLTTDDAPRFAEFIKYLGAGLHAEGKILTVTVEHSMFSSDDIDWTALSKEVDRIRIMAYQYHYDRTDPGAISPPEAVFGLARRALSLIPADKVEIALPMYGFDWASTGGAKVVSTTSAYARLTHRPGAQVFRDPRTQCARIVYETSAGRKRSKKSVHHEVWFEDAVSMAYKANLLQQMGIVHIGLWQLGAGDLTPLFRLVKFRPV